MTKTQEHIPESKKGFRVEELGRPECPYLKRWLAQFGFFSVRLHHWRGSDDTRALHDHPWWFITLVLKGGYFDVAEDRPCEHCDKFSWEVFRDEHGVSIQCNACDSNARFAEQDYLGPGSVRFRPAFHTHTVQVDPGGCWSLLITGPKSRDWGFWVDGKWKRMRKYFKEHGHHPCEE